MTEPLQQSVEEIEIVFLDESFLAEAEQCLFACEYCAENAVIALDYLLDVLTGCDPTVTEYLMCRPACCPSCSSQITEKTLVVV
jgi:hypothetical protein